MLKVGAGGAERGEGGGSDEAVGEVEGAKVFAVGGDGGQAAVSDGETAGEIEGGEVDFVLEEGDEIGVGEGGLVGAVDGKG